MGRGSALHTGLDHYALDTDRQRGPGGQPRMRPMFWCKARSRQGTTERLIMAKALLDQALGSGNWEILEEFTGRDLDGLFYDRLYEPKAEFVAAR